MNRMPADAAVPYPSQAATETIDIDLAIVSVGVSPNPIVPSSIKGLELGRKGNDCRQ